jgi:general stress protein 26
VTDGADLTFGVGDRSNPKRPGRAASRDPWAARASTPGTASACAPPAEPTGELDPRFSDPDAEPTPWSEIVAVLESAELSWLTTVRADGRPHVTPLVTIWQEGALYFCTGPGEQKAVNLEQQQHVAVTTGCNGWRSGLDVVVEGEAERVTDRRRLERLADAWATKWDGSWRFAVDDEGFRNELGGLALVFGVRPTKVLAFAKGTFGHTRYRSLDADATG